MSFNATGSYRCDGCKVCESEPVALVADSLSPLLPGGWLRVETTERVNAVLITRSISHYCQLCKPLIVSYLAGRREAPHAAD
jgi:hypothetical protein